MADDIDFSGMTSEEVGRALAEKTFRELSQKPEIPHQDSRNWQDTEGYRYLYPWSNGVLLRFLIRKFTDGLPEIERRRKKQFDDAGRSYVRNIEEGFKRPTTKEYLEFLGFSQASLEECKGDTRESAEDKFLKSISGSSLKSIGIDLKEFNFSLRKKRQQYSTLLREGIKENVGEKLEEKLKEIKKEGSSFNPSSNFSSNRSSNSLLNPPPEDIFAYHDITDLYPPLKKIKAEDLTYEIFMELINKTDYLVRNLVVSLENKLANDKKYYQVEQIRLNRRSKGKDKGFL